MLGNHVSLQAVESVLDSVKHHGSRGIEFPDFIDIMSRDSRDLADDDHSQSNSSATTAYNIALMARAYRWRSATHKQSQAYVPALSGLVHHNKDNCTIVYVSVPLHKTHIPVQHALQSCSSKM